MRTRNVTAFAVLLSCMGAAEVEFSTQLEFLHVPKTGGTFLNTIIKEAVAGQPTCEIHGNNHQKYAWMLPRDKRAFAVIRET